MLNKCRPANRQRSPHFKCRGRNLRQYREDKTMWFSSCPGGSNERHRTRESWVFLASMLLWISFASTSVSSSEYRLNAGDLLRISVYGETMYPLETRIDADGKIRLPLIDEIDARDRSVQQLVDEIVGKFQERELLRDPLVQVEVTEYRPFFITGAVAAPGAYPYKPRMSVRHALALAGGFRAVKIGDKAPLLTVADLKSEQVSQIMEMFRFTVQLARLKAELQDRDHFAIPDDIPPELPAEFIVDILDSEQDQLQLRRDQFDTWVSELQAVLEEARHEQEAISSAKAKKALVISDQLKEAETTRQLASKGLVKGSILLQAERAYNNYSEELNQIEVQDSKHQQNIINLEAELKKLRAQRRVDTINQIQTAQLAVANARSKVQFISEQLSFINTYGEHRRFDQMRDSVRIIILRPIKQGTTEIRADENTSVMPDDVIDVGILVDQSYFDSRSIDPVGVRRVDPLAVTAASGSGGLNH